MHNFVVCQQQWFKTKGTAATAMWGYARPRNVSRENTPNTSTHTRKKSDGDKGSHKNGAKRIYRHKYQRRPFLYKVICNTTATCNVQMPKMSMLWKVYQINWNHWTYMANEQAMVQWRVYGVIHMNSETTDNEPTGNMQCTMLEDNIYSDELNMWYQSQT